MEPRASRPATWTAKEERIYLPPDVIKVEMHEDWSAKWTVIVDGDFPGKANDLQDAYRIARERKAAWDKSCDEQDQESATG